MNKLLLISILAGGYYFYTLESKSASEQIFDVENNPIIAKEYIELWKIKAIEGCEINAKDYNIDINSCETYISNKFPACESKLPATLPYEISSKKQGGELIKSYYSCIAAHPHCNGHEIKTEYDYRQHCKNV